MYTPPTVGGGPRNGCLARPSSGAARARSCLLAQYLRVQLLGLGWARRPVRALRKAVPPGAYDLRASAHAAQTGRVPASCPQLEKGTLMTATTPDLTGAWDIDPAHSRLGFAARHAMVATVHGTFQVVSGVLHLDHADPEKSSAEVEIDSASVNTGNEQRDAHLRSQDSLHVEKSRKLTIPSTRAPLLNTHTQIKPLPTH